MIAFTVTVTTPLIQTLTGSWGSSIKSYVSRAGLEYASAIRQGSVFGFRIRPAVAR